MKRLLNIKVLAFLKLVRIENLIMIAATQSVSYTHLTLPTILRV